MGGTCIFLRCEIGHGSKAACTCSLPCIHWRQGLSGPAAAVICNRAPNSSQLPSPAALLRSDLRFVDFDHMLGTLSHRRVTAMRINRFKALAGIRQQGTAAE